MQKLGKQASDYIIRNVDQLTEDIIVCQSKVQPDFQERYDAQRIEYCRRDIKLHLKFLSNALTFMSKGLFGSYVEWVRGLLLGLKIRTEDITINFQCIIYVIYVGYNGYCYIAWFQKQWKIKAVSKQCYFMTVLILFSK